MFGVFSNSGFLILLMMAFVLQQPETLFLGGCLCAAYAIFSAKNFHLERRRFFAALMAVFVSSLAVLSFNHGPSPVFYLISTFSAFYAAKYFSDYSIKHISRCLEIVFWLAIVAIGCVLWRYWGYPEPLGEVVPGTSTNGIPSYLIVFQIALSLSVFLDKKRLPVWSPVFTLAVAVIGLGRGSIIVAAAILFLSVFVDFFLKEMKPLSRLVIVVFSVIFFVVIVFVFRFYFDDELFFDELINGSKFSEGLLDPYRAEIFDEYVRKLDLFSIFFGADYSGTVIASRYDGNPHIAYVRTHAYFGLFGLLLVILSPLAILVSSKRRLYKFVFISFISFAMIRAISEPIFFPTLLDFFYFLYFFIFFKYAPTAMFKNGRPTC